MLGPRSMTTGYTDTGAGTPAYSSNLGSAGPGGYDVGWNGGAGIGIAGGGGGGGGVGGMIGNGVGGGGGGGIGVGGGVWADGGRGGYGEGAVLHHRTSAKRLIDRYERLSTPPPGTRSGANAPLRRKSTKSHQYVYDYRTEAGHSNYLATPDRGSDGKFKQKYGFGGGAGGPGRKETTKDRSPIRQSLRNLLSVFKKGAGGLSKRKSEDKDFAGAPYVYGAVGSTPPARIEEAEVVVGDGEQAKPPPRPRKKMTGSLLYLTRSLPPNANEDPSQLEWTSCGVTLDAHKLVLSSFTGNMDLHVHEISLSRCADIRSVSAGQLSADEVRLLEEAGAKLECEKSGLKVFELIFEGRPKEKFAARSVRERAGWISAIWDAILPDKDAKCYPVEQGVAPAPVPKETVQPQQHKPIESPVPRHIPEMSTLLGSSHSERSLPALPIDPPSTSVAPLSIPDKPTRTKPPNLHIDLSGISGPISPSLYPPSSHASTAGTSPAASPLETPKKNLHLQIDTSNRLLSPTSAGVPLPLSASTYSSTSRPGSLFLSSPTRSSCPTSPSIANLSQLSVVRQRLAQIERNHSQLSAQSSFSPRVASRPSTPMTVRSPPVSPSARSARKEYFSSVTTPKVSPQLPSPVALSRVVSKERGELPVPVTRTMTKSRTSQRPKSDEKEDESVPPKQTKYREKKKKEKAPTAEEEIMELSKGLSEIRSVLGGESGYPTIHQVVLGLDHRTRGDKQAFKTVQDKLDLLGDRVTNAIASSSPAAAATAASNVGVESGAQQALVESNQKLVRAMEEVKARLAVDFPALASKIKEVREIQNEVRKSAKEREGVYNNIGASSSSDKNGGKDVDIQPVLDKLEELRKLCEAPAKVGPQELDNTRTEYMEKILALIQADGNKQVLLSQQQAESVRYLNELNTWLESFVNNGVSQIQGLSTNIEHLCRNLGCDPLTIDGPNGQEDQTPSLLNDIRQLVFGMKARDQNFAALQAAVHSLLEVLSASQNQMGADSRAIAGMIDQQRRDQEILFRTFTNEISGEIKGERLRFVEAMKEATAINVQIHVEQFKQELSKEVMGMTQEVGRLHQEKLHIENQISDLFAFYSKHRQKEMPLHGPQSSSTNPNMPEISRANIPRSSNHRPLPYPRQQ